MQVLTQVPDIKGCVNLAILGLGSRTFYELCQIHRTSAVSKITWVHVTQDFLRWFH